MHRLVELTMRERPPWTAELPLCTLRNVGTPVLIVSGGHARLFELCVDALAEELAPHAERTVIRGAGHAVQRLGEPFNALELSTLSVHLEPFGVAPAGGPEGLLDGLGTGWRTLVSTLGAAVVVLGILLPWLAVAALVAAGVLVPVRLARRRAAVEAPVPPQG